jgi:hypothetical protein
MEVPCRGAGPEPRPPLAFVGIPGNSSGEEEETGENGRVERGGRDRRGMSRKDVQPSTTPNAYLTPGCQWQPARNQPRLPAEPLKTFKTPPAVGGTTGYGVYGAVLRRRVQRVVHDGGDGALRQPRPAAPARCDPPHPLHAFGFEPAAPGPHRVVGRTAPPGHLVGRHPIGGQQQRFGLGHLPVRQTSTEPTSPTPGVAPRSSATAQWAFSFGRTSRRTPATTPTVVIEQLATWTCR